MEAVIITEPKENEEDEVVAKTEPDQALVGSVPSPARAKHVVDDVLVSEKPSGPVRSKLAYLLDPKSSTGAPGKCASEPVAKSTTEDDAPAVAEEVGDRCTAYPEPASLLLVKSSKCKGCGSEDIDKHRVFVEHKAAYCKDCWSTWDRSGWWRPSIRVLTTRPEIGPSGLPEYGPADAFSVPAFLCDHKDLGLFERLRSELPVGKDFIDWHGSRHMGIQFQGEGARHDGDNAPVALRETVARLENAFGIRAEASRLNLYRDSKDYKPFHYDRGRSDEGVPQVTVGASFGATRELTFVHVASGVTMTFPQRNGDVFAFTPEINNVFMHGVPKLGFGTPARADEGPRLSLILWGTKRLENVAEPI